MRAPVRPRRLFRVSDCATYRPEKILEGPRFRRISRSEYRGDRQPDYDCVASSFHQHCFVPPACYACLLIALNHWNGRGSELEASAVRSQEKPQDSPNPAAFYR
jgi:hypothetical protein